MRRTPGLALASLLASLVLHCGGGLQGAKADFKAGRMPEAKARLLALEPETASWDECRRAEYALYRGLVAGSLGDAPEAKRWLAGAKATTDQRADCLSPDDASRLKLGVDSYP
jgi:hypothetical protein